MMQIEWARVAPVLVSIGVIIFIAILRQYSKTFAAIAATMPINIPLALWIVYSGENNSRAALQEFNQGLLIGIIPTVFFLIVTYLASREGWGLLPTIGAGYLAWGIVLGLTFVVRRMVGI